MARYYYKKGKRKNTKRIIRLISLGISLIGFFSLFIVTLPIITGSTSASITGGLTSPVPKTTILTSFTVQSIISQSVNAVTGFDSTNARNWFPNVAVGNPTAPISSYTLSIPKLNIRDAEVTTVDNDLSKHLVNYGGTAIPPNKGTAAIYGHSTLPWLFDPKDYKAIFATLHTLETEDTITVKVNDTEYTYKIFEMTVVEKTSTAILEQNYNDSYITLVTCSPPGTTWKRLLIKARLVGNNA